MRRWLVGMCAAAALAVPTSAVAWEIGNAPGVVYGNVTAVDTQAQLRMLATKYVSSGGANPIYHCAYYVVIEYKPVLQAVRYEYTWRTSAGRSSSWVNVSTNGGDNGAAGTAWEIQGTNHTPSAGTRFVGSTSIGYITRGDVTVGTNESCATDPTQGGNNEVVRMVGFVDSSLVPTSAPTTQPTPVSTSTPLVPVTTPGPLPVATPTPTPAPALELLPPAKGALARLQSASGQGGAAAEVYVTRAGTTYRADASSTFEFGDVVKVGSKTVLALEYAIGGRVGLGPGAEVRVIGERQIELLGGTTEVGPVDRAPLEIQTNGGTMGIRG